MRPIGHDNWVPGAPGLFCALVALACLVHARTAHSSATSGMWSLTLMLLAADIGLLRIFTLGIYPNDPRMIGIGLVELAVMVAAAALVAPDALRLSRRGSREVAGAEDRARPLRNQSCEDASSPVFAGRGQTKNSTTSR